MRPRRVRSWVRRGGVRGTFALVLALVSAVGGGTALAWAGSHQMHAPQPAAAQSGTLSPALGSSRPRATLSRPAGPPSSSSSPSGSPGAVAAAPVVGPTLSRSVPTAITIPAIGVASALLELGRNADGSLQVPQPGPHYDQAAWYDGLRTPGELGPAVIEGHVDSASHGRSVFFRLGALSVGDNIYLTRADRTVAVFAVSAVRSYPKDAFPNNEVYGATDHAALRLLTCSGAFDRTTGSYRSNIVVYAHLTGAQPLTAPTRAR